MGRGRVVLVVSPARVQGEGANTSIVHALDLIDRDPRVEVVIIGRGGGSGEDLMAFNDERVVRRIAAMRVPTVSAVGHEIDTTLADLVADVRAATPSHAAELVVADDTEQQKHLHTLATRLRRAVTSRLLEDRAVADRLRVRLTDPRFMIAERRQLLDDLTLRSERIVNRVVAHRRSALERLLQRLQARHPRVVIATARIRLSPLNAALHNRVQLLLNGHRSTLASHAAKLDALSPLTVLGRGYSIATADDGRVIRSAAQVQEGDLFNLRLLAGSLRAKVLGGHK
jgi:exodeoxyribonuclease VII large subunit